MRRIKILVDGQTEETFVRDVLYPYFQQNRIDITPIIIRTSKTGKGGDIKYDRVKPQAMRLCLTDPSCIVTTMFNYYGLKNDFPGFSIRESNLSIEEKVKHIEFQIKEDLALPNFIPNLLIHEFEAILFSDPNKFESWFNEKMVKLVAKDREAFSSPELINDGLQSAPSKRLLKNAQLCGYQYEKVLHGPIISLDIGLEKIKKECTHFAHWIDSLLVLK